MGLTGKIIVAMVLGIILGLFLNYSGLNGEGSFVNTYIVAKSEGRLDLTIYNDPDAGAKDVFDGHIDESSEREFSKVFSDSLIGSEYDEVNRRP